MEPRMSGLSHFVLEDPEMEGPGMPVQEQLQPLSCGRMHPMTENNIMRQILYRFIDIDL